MGQGRFRVVALSALAIAVALASATPGEGKPDPEQSESGAALPATVARGDCDSAMTAADVEQAPKRVIGQVTSLDDGRVMLATRSGPVALRASADTLAALAVGDVIVLELTPEPDAIVSFGDDCP